MNPYYIPLFIIAFLNIVYWLFVGIALKSMLAGRINADAMAMWVIAGIVITGFSGAGMFSIAEAMQKGTP